MSDPYTIDLYPAWTMLRGRTVTPMPPSWPSKDPTNVRIFRANFAGVLAGGVLQSAQARATPPLVPLQCTVTGSLVSIVLSGGTDGQIARVEITATLVDGQTDTRALLLPIIAQGTLEGDTVATSPTTTTTSEPTVIATIPIVGLPGAAVNVEGPVLARNVATGDACSFRVAAVVENIGTDAATAGSPSITAYAPPPPCLGVG